MDDLLREGYAELGNMNFNTAAALFEQVLEQSSKESRAWFGLSKVAFEKRDYRAALEKVDRALRLRDRARWRIFRGEILLAKGDRATAAREWQQVLDRYPDDEKAKKVASGHLSKIGVGVDK